VKPNITSVEIHPQLSNSRHPADDGVLVGAASVWPGNFLFGVATHVLSLAFFSPLWDQN
jgi:hypothetical protein